MTTMIIDNLPLVASSVDGVKKLRELILTLAVRGKLVPHNRKDEPSSELVKRMKVYEAKLVESGFIRKQKRLNNTTASPKHFLLPPNWAWVQLGEIGDWGAGATPLRSNPDFYDGTIPWFKSGELTSDLISESEEKITELALKQCSLRENKIGDVLVAMYGATIGKTAILGCAATTNQAVCACTPFPGLNNKFLLLTLKALKPLLISQGAGGAQPNISREKIVATVIGLPPLAEQELIVAKVDELMELCDRLEAQQSDAESAHKQLTKAFLNALTQSSDQKDFIANWERIKENFDVLFCTNNSIDILKQTVLELAIMGKLVPQDSKEEPASMLVTKLQQLNTNLAKGRTPKLQSDFLVDEEPFALPQSWKWVRLASLTSKIGAGSTPLGGKQGYVKEGVIFLRSQNVWNDGLYLEDVALIPPEVHRKMSGTHVQAGDLVFNITGASIGRCARVPIDFDAGNVSQHVTIIRPLDPKIQEFLHKVLISNYVQKAVMNEQVGVSREGLSVGKLAQFLVPLPPLEEQRRIVAKVNTLLATCDELKALLREGKKLQEIFAIAVTKNTV